MTKTDAAWVKAWSSCALRSAVSPVTFAVNAVAKHCFDGTLCPAQYCPVVLTDHNEEVLSVLKRNAALNRDSTSHGEAPHEHLPLLIACNGMQA